MSICNKIRKLPSRLMLYLIVMLIGVALRTYVTHSITIVWIVNLVGFVLLFLPYFRYINTTIAEIIFIYLFFSLLTVVFNFKYLTNSVKTLGTNINILILPLMLCMMCSSRTKMELNETNLITILRFISLTGLISLAYTWIIDFHEIIKVFAGTSAYQVNVSGFFYSKNIYGAFVSLTMAADLYLLSIKKHIVEIPMIGIKILAVILSFSRAALLQAGVTIFVFLWIKKRRMARDYITLAIFFLLFIGVIVYVINNSLLYNFAYNSVFRINVGDAGREVLRNQAIEKVENNVVEMIFGVGFAGIDILDIDVDNTYLYVFFSGGIFKILFYLVSILLSIIKILRMKLYNENLYRVCLSVLVSYLFFAYFESVAVLELGLLNFVYTFFVFFIPFSYVNRSIE